MDFKHPEFERVLPLKSHLFRQCSVRFGAKGSVYHGKVSDVSVQSSDMWWAQILKQASQKVWRGLGQWFLIPAHSLHGLMNDAGHDFTLCRSQQNELRSFLEPDWLFETHNHRARPIGAVVSFVKFCSWLNCLLDMSFKFKCVLPSLCLRLGIFQAYYISCPT